MKVKTEDSLSENDLTVMQIVLFLYFCLELYSVFYPFL